MTTNQNPPTLLKALEPWPDLLKRVIGTNPKELTRLEMIWRESEMTAEEFVHRLVVIPSTATTTGRIKIFPKERTQGATQARLADPVGTDDHVKPIAEVVDGKGCVYSRKPLDVKAAEFQEESPPPARRWERSVRKAAVPACLRQACRASSDYLSCQGCQR